MNEIITCQGKTIKKSDFLWLKTIINDNPDWSRHQITKEICDHWNWRTQTGHLKTFAARSMIDKLEQRGFIDLPPVRTTLRRNLRPPFPEGFTPPLIHSVEEKLKGLLPLSIHIPAPCSYEEACFGYYLSKYHYLGFHRTVGQNLKIIIKDRFARDLACLLFGSAAWQTEPRDRFIGWIPEIRSRNINLMTNNTRFLIFPWVRVPHLASHILGLVTRHLQQYWLKKYNHPIHMVETFVEKHRFNGTCYKAANWIRVGQTKGRSRQERHGKMVVPIKDIFLYPLSRNFRQALCGESS
ncbi:Druantia anti-phage system protein DruA [Thermodesulfobacteriota bacterium]